MRLIWAEQAELDLYRIAEDYSAIGTGLDKTLLERIYEAPLILLERPRLGPKIDSLDLRKWQVKRTPFVLLYRVLGEHVEIARVVPAMSDWRGK